MDKWSGSREQAASASQMTDGSIAFSAFLAEVTLDDRLFLLPGDCVDISFLPFFSIQWKFLSTV